MSEPWAVILIGALGFIVNIVVLSVGGTWALARTAASINKTIVKHRLDTDGEFTVLRRETGEIAAALRTKINEVELWARDNFVRRDSFLLATQRIETSVAAMGQQIEARLVRMEDKLDTAAAGTKK